MKENLLKVFNLWKSGRPIDDKLLSKNFDFIGPSKMMTTQVWKELSNDLQELDVTMLNIICDDSSGAILFEYNDHITLNKYRSSWFVKFDQNGKLVQLIETKEAVES